MVAGLAVQVFSLITFIVLCLEYAIRVQKNRWRLNTRYTDLYQSLKFKSFLFALGSATIFLFVRAVFRVAELSGSFKGKLAQNQVLFMVLDGAMVLLACIILVALHPGVAFKGVWEEASFRWGSSKSSDRSVEHSTNIETVTFSNKDRE